MSEIQPWLGMCHLTKGEGDEQESYQAIAAVFCPDRETYDKLLHKFLEPKGYQLLWSEEVHPAGQWITRFPQDRSAAGLARAVHPQHLIEIGTLKAAGKEGEEPEEPEYLTITEHDIPPMPDQADVPFWDREWIADELKELLFGQQEDGEKVRTYFIVDATLRKNITGVFDLDSIDVPIQCLFKGDAAEELKEAAPYLIDMTLPEGAWKDKDKVPAFHKDFFAKHWDQNTGIFIRTPALMADVWGHFRKFTRVQVEEDKRWVFFRFWEPTMIPYFLRGTDKQNLDAFWGCDFELHTIDDAGSWLKIRLTERPTETSSRTILMKAQDFDSFKLFVHMRYYHQLKNWIIGTFGNPCEIAEIDSFLRSEVQFAINTFRTGDKRIIAHYVAASWLLGERVYKNDKVSQNDIRLNSRGARTLYERAYKYRNGEQAA